MRRGFANAYGPRGNRPNFPNFRQARPEFSPRSDQRINNSPDFGQSQQPTGAVGRGSPRFGAQRFNSTENSRTKSEDGKLAQNIAPNGEGASADINQEQVILSDNNLDIVGNKMPIGNSITAVSSDNSAIDTIPATIESIKNINSNNIDLEEGELEEEERNNAARLAAEAAKITDWKSCKICDINFSSKEEFVEHVTWNVSHQLKSKQSKEANASPAGKDTKTKELLEATSTSEMVLFDSTKESCVRSEVEPSSSSDMEPTSTNQELPCWPDVQTNVASQQQNVQQSDKVVTTANSTTTTTTTDSASVDSNTINCVTCGLRFKKSEHYEIHVRGIVHLQKTLMQQGISAEVAAAALSSNAVPNDNPTEQPSVSQSSDDTSVAAASVPSDVGNKPPDQRQEDWRRCNDCNISFNNPGDYNVHLASDVHKTIKALNAAKKTQPSGAGGDVRPPVAGAPARSPVGTERWLRPLRPSGPLRQMGPRQPGASSDGAEVGIRGPPPNQSGQPMAARPTGPTGPRPDAQRPQVSPVRAGGPGMGMRPPPTGARPPPGLTGGPPMMARPPPGAMQPFRPGVNVGNAGPPPRPGVSAGQRPPVRPYTPGQRPPVGQSTPANAGGPWTGSGSGDNGGSQAKRPKLIAQIQAELDQCNRPLLGLEHIIEYVDKDTGQRLSNEFWCDLCESYMTSSAQVISHVTGQKHRHNCFQEHYPHEFDRLVAESNNPVGASLNELYEKFASEVERRDGRHTVSVKDIDSSQSEDETKYSHPPPQQQQQQTQFQPMQPPYRQPPPMQQQSFPPPAHQPNYPPPAQQQSSFPPPTPQQNYPPPSAQQQTFPPPSQQQTYPPPTQQQAYPPPAQQYQQPSSYATSQPPPQFGQQQTQQPPYAQPDGGQQSQYQADAAPPVHSQQWDNRMPTQHNQQQQQQFPYGGVGGGPSTANRMDQPPPPFAATQGQPMTRPPTANLDLNNQTMQTAANRAIELLHKLSTAGVDNDEEAEVAYKLSTALSQALVEYRSRKEQGKVPGGSQSQPATQSQHTPGQQGPLPGAMPQPYATMPQQQAPQAAASAQPSQQSSGYAAPGYSQPASAAPPSAAGYPPAPQQPPAGYPQPTAQYPPYQYPPYMTPGQQPGAYPPVQQAQAAATTTAATTAATATAVPAWPQTSYATTDPSQAASQAYYAQSVAAWQQSADATASSSATPTATPPVAGQWPYGQPAMHWHPGYPYGMPMPGMPYGMPGPYNPYGMAMPSAVATTTTASSSSAVPPIVSYQPGAAAQYYSSQAASATPAVPAAVPNYNLSLPPGYQAQPPLPPEDGKEKPPLPASPPPAKKKKKNKDK